MNIIIQPSKLKGVVNVVSSKSLSHRYVIAAGLATGTSKIHNVLDSKDLEATKKALEGLNVSFVDDKIIPSTFKLMNDFVDCNESGSTLRFMIPIYMLQEKKVVFKGQGELINRPLDIYEQLFKDKGLVFNYLTKEYNLPLEVQGVLKGGHYQLSGNVSSQFISGLLFALPLVENDSVIELLTPLSSKGYVDMTLATLDEFGVKFKYKNNQIFIKGGQKYRPKTLTVEGDFSQAAFWLVAATINQGTPPLSLRDLNISSHQGDKEIIEIIHQMGGKITYNEHSKEYLAYPKSTQATTIDLDQIPDLGPVLMVLAALSDGETHFIGCKRLKIKESNRLTAMFEILTKLGVNMRVTEDEAWISGRTSFNGDVTLSSYHDHRIAMAITIASLRASGPITLLDSHVVEKSYPNFFEVFKKLGGQFHEIK